jgi:hypothetical protein
LCVYIGLMSVYGTDRRSKSVEVRNDAEIRAVRVAVMSPRVCFDGTAVSTGAKVETQDCTIKPLRLKRATGEEEGEMEG